MRRNSVQREIIYEYIKRTSSHPSALTVYKALKKRIPSLSLGNTYRNIRILVEEKIIVTRKFSNGLEHYDAVTKAHYHFICDVCGKISDFPMPYQEHIETMARNITEKLVRSHTVQFSGICEQCIKKQKKHIPNHPSKRFVGSNKKGGQP